MKSLSNRRCKESPGLRDSPPGLAAPPDPEVDRCLELRWGSARAEASVSSDRRAENPSLGVWLRPRQIGRSGYTAQRNNSFSSDDVFDGSQTLLTPTESFRSFSPPACRAPPSRSPSRRPSTFSGSSFVDAARWAEEAVMAELRATSARRSATIRRSSPSPSAPSPSRGPSRVEWPRSRVARSSSRTTASRHLSDLRCPRRARARGEKPLRGDATEYPPTAMRAGLGGILPIILAKLRVTAVELSSRGERPYVTARAEQKEQHLASRGC